GELECAFSAAGRVTPHGHPAPRFLAVTGTNGKSTTTTLLYEMMRNAGYGVLLCGNIGVSVSEALLASGLADVGAAFRRAIDFFVVEVSSFQLDSVETFRPSGATILNVAPDHLDRYRGMDAYVASKSRIFENQGSPDVLVLNADDPFAPELDLKWEGLSELPDVYYFSRKQVVRGAYTAGSKVVLSFGGTEHSIDISTFGIRGAHNVENAMAASLLALTAGAGIDAVEKALREFRGLEHRMELVREVDGVQYVNDSKGTNVAAVMKSLESYTQPVILIAGGRDKDGDFNLLREPVREKVKTLILIGEAAHKISEALGDMTRTVYADSLKEAVATARAHAVPGDIVLLSPACASFDMFRNYEDRGDQFKMLVRSL
ncbi:MAG TPA: UDP-N-acetylmuramoyl-L-alanine--D-glutamate ligase, partial [Dissulfurispiraceae bacterium]|nr:UDP-N-acetylmuramoyl-L-alanine--D-glutamate ligase [Dissulfurispiraceae bacterium]